MRKSRGATYGDSSRDEDHVRPEETTSEQRSKAVKDPAKQASGVRATQMREPMNK